MFYAIAVIECLAVSFLVGLSVCIFCLPASRFVQTRISTNRPGITANLLVLLRLLPAGLAALLTIGFALPAFLVFEPHPSTDYIGPLQISMAAGGALILAIITSRIWRVLRATFWIEQQWKNGATRIQIPGVTIPTYRLERIPSLFVVTGVLRPTVFIGHEIIEKFSSQEMAAAISHEMAHIRSRDNLKQFFLEISRPPAWLMKFGVPDSVWLDTAELAADRAALSNGSEPLHLASALLKACRLSGVQARNSALLGSHLLPAHSGVRLEKRVSQLVELAETGPDLQRPLLSPRMMTGVYMATLLVGVLSYAANANAVLRSVERALDILF